MLTSEQRKAVESKQRFVGVIAGAGTGKTHLLVARAIHLVSTGADPRSILLLTFTNRASGQLRDALSKAGVRGVRVGTFHAIAHSLNTDYNVMSPEQHAAITAKIAKSVKDAHQANKVYKDWMRVNKQSDFHFLIELLQESVHEGRLSDVKHVLVDEAQDTDTVQWAVIDELNRCGADLFAVGDPKQQLYEWRGADSHEFTRRIEDLHVLTRSFRFGKAIAKVHNRLCADGHLDGTDADSRLWIGSGNAASQVEILMDEMYAPRDIAVLCRTNRQVKFSKKVLADRSIPIEDNQGFDCAELDLLKFICNPSSQTERSARLLGEVPKSHPLYGLSGYAGSPSVWIERWLAGEFVVPTVSAVLKSLAPETATSARIIEAVGDLPIRDGVAELVLGSSEIQESRSGVTVCTVHQAKGLQFPAVIAVCGDARDNPEEDRVALVQATRAQERLHVVDNNANFFGGLARAVMSVITQSLKDELLESIK